MPNIIQALHSTTPGARPTGRKPAELWVNLADGVAGFIDQSGAAVPFPAAFVLPHDPAKAYASGDLVWFVGNLYRAAAAVPAGNFDATKWHRISMDTTGDAMTGPLAITDAAANKVKLLVGEPPGTSLSIHGLQRPDALIGGSVLSSGLLVATTGTNSALGGAVHVGRSNGGTLAAPVAVPVNFQLGRYAFAGWDGTRWLSSAYVSASVLAMNGAEMIGELQLETNQPGNVTPTSKLRISHAGATFTVPAAVPVGAAAAPALKVGTRADGLMADGVGLGIVNSGVLTHRFLPDAIHATIPNCRYLVTDAAIGIVINGLRPINGHAQSAYGIINDLGGNLACGTRVYNDGTASFCIDVDINAAQSGLKEFNFRGNGIAYSAGGWQPGSDARVKTNVQPITGALAKIAAIKGYTYDRADLGTTGHAGVLAQEVQAVLPQAVSISPLQLAEEFRNGDPTGFRTVDPMALIATLIEAVHELSAKVTALESRQP